MPTNAGHTRRHNRQNVYPFVYMLRPRPSAATTRPARRDALGGARSSAPYAPVPPSVIMPLPCVCLAYAYGRRHDFCLVGPYTAPLPPPCPCPHARSTYINSDIGCFPAPCRRSSSSIPIAPAVVPRDAHPRWPSRSHLP
ncbi:hypothetical protein VTO73DRAFT_5439 [Trametes versicolor]